MSAFEKLLEEEARTNPAIRTQRNFYSLPAINALAYASTMKELMSRKITAKVALMRLIAIKSGYRWATSIGVPSPNLGADHRNYEAKLVEHVNSMAQSQSLGAAIKSMHADYANSLANAYRHIEQELTRTGSSSLDFLLMPQWRVQAGELTGLLRTLDYEALLADELPKADGAKESCDALLMKSA